MDEMIDIKVVASCYTSSIYVIFGENDYIDKYELYKNDKLLDTFTKDTHITEFNHQGETDIISRPCLFDHDKHTNLFWKDSNHQWMYDDKDVNKYQEYSYYIKYYHGDQSWNTDTKYVTLH